MDKSTYRQTTHRQTTHRQTTHRQTTHRQTTHKQDNSYTTLYRQTKCRHYILILY